MNRRAAIGVGLVVLALAGCTSAPAPLPAPSPTPSATAAAPLPSGIDLTCEDLVEGLGLRARIPGAVLRTDPAAELMTFESSTMNEPAVIAAAGGLTCYWSATSAVSNRWVRPPDGYTGLSIAILPNADALWDDLEHPEAGWAICSDRVSTDEYETRSFCHSERLAGSSWVEMRAVGIDEGLHATEGMLTDSVARFFDSISRVIEAAPVGPLHSLENVAEIPERCSEVLANVTSDLFSSIEVFDAQQGPTQFDAALAASGSLTCYWETDVESSHYGRLRVLAGGSAMLHEALSVDHPGYGPAERVAVQGLGVGDGAWARCETVYGCIIELDIGGHWVQLEIIESEWVEAYTDPAESLAVITVIANAVVDRVG
jgi:hypothetical protein